MSLAYMRVRARVHRAPAAGALLISLALAAFGMALLLAGCGNGSEGSEGETSQAGSDPAGFDDIPEIVAAAEPSVVAVLVGEAGRGGQGSGVIWDEEGLIVTNHHVVSGAEQVTVALATGEQMEAEIGPTDPLSDIAVLEVDRDGLPAAEFADEVPPIGELAVAIGNPLGFENTITEGIVSGVNRSIPSGGQTPALVDLIQTSAPISPGNSGGALVGADASVIGLNVAYIPPQVGAVSLGFAIPAPTVSAVVETLLEEGEIRHAFLGIQPAPLTPQIRDQFGIEATDGVLVQAVTEGSAADRAGMQPGDVLTSLAGRDITAPEDLFAELRDHEPGDTVAATVSREGEARELEITLGERPEALPG